MSINRFTVYSWLLPLLFFQCVFLTVPAFADIQNPSPSEKRLVKDLDDIVQDTSFSSALLGMHIESIDTGEVLYSYNSNKRFIPASNIKLFTTAAALVRLTPHFSYTTYLLTNGSILAGILYGDLIILGKGDPAISSYYHSGRAEAVFETWVDTMKQYGIQKVEGNIIVDNSYFQDTPLGKGWSWDDELFCFSSEKDAFSFNNNCLKIVVRESKVGECAIIQLEPETRYYTIENKIVTVGKNGMLQITIERGKEGNTLKLSGTFPSGEKEYRTYVSVKNPWRFGATVLKEIMERKGITVTGSIYNQTMASHVPYTIIDSYHSPPLSHIITVINKESNNLQAELLFLTLGKEQKGKGDSDTGQAVIKEFLDEQRISTNDFYMVDGSGLSRYNLVTPKTIVQLLRFMAHHHYFEQYYNSLSIAGVDGTLKNRMKQKPLVNRIRGKTGVMKNIRNLSGYLQTLDGELIAFSFMCNNFSVPPQQINLLYEAICLRLINFSRK